MQLVIFDVDGTLVYSERRDSRSFAEAFHLTFGQPLPSIDWHNYPHVTDTNIFHHVLDQLFGRAAIPEELEEFMTKYLAILAQKRQSTPDQYLMIPGARSCLEQLSQTPDTQIGIGTGGWKRPAELKLQHVDIAYEQFLFHGADGHFTREAIINAVIDEARQLNSNLERIIYIGDALWDVKTTRNLNMPFIGIRWRNDKHVLENAGAQHVIQDFRDFESFYQVLSIAQPPR